MFLYLFSFHSDEGNKGYKEALRLWGLYFKKSSHFRKLFFLVFYIALILFRTVLNRDLWIYPLRNVFGGWWIWESSQDGTFLLSTACIENFLLLIPYAIILSSCLCEKNKLSKGPWSIIWKSFYCSFLFSLSIELFQLVFRIGNFQLSDIVYNTAGGVVGAVCYLIYYLIKHIIKKNKKV